MPPSRPTAPITPARAPDDSDVVRRWQLLLLEATQRSRGPAWHRELASLVLVPESGPIVATLLSEDVVLPLVVALEPWMSPMATDRETGAAVRSLLATLAQETVQPGARSRLRTLLWQTRYEYPGAPDIETLTEEVANHPVPAIRQHFWHLIRRREREVPAWDPVTPAFRSRLWAATLGESDPATQDVLARRLKTIYAPGLSAGSGTCVRQLSEAAGNELRAAIEHAPSASPLRSALLGVLGTMEGPVAQELQWELFTAARDHEGPLAPDDWAVAQVHEDRTRPSPVSRSRPWTQIQSGPPGATAPGPRGTATTEALRILPLDRHARDLLPLYEEAMTHGHQALRGVLAIRLMRQVERGHVAARDAVGLLGRVMAGIPDGTRRVPWYAFGPGWADPRYRTPVLERVGRDPAALRHALGDAPASEVPRILAAMGDLGSLPGVRLAEGLNALVGREGVEIPGEVLAALLAHDDAGVRSAALLLTPGVPHRGRGR